MSPAEKAGLAASGCGLTIEGEHVFCDDPRASDESRQTECDCRRMIAAALAAQAPVAGVPIVDKSIDLSEPVYVTQEQWDRDMADYGRQLNFFNSLIHRLPVPNDLPSIEAVADWIVEKCGPVAVEPETRDAPPEAVSDLIDRGALTAQLANLWVLRSRLRSRSRTEFFVPGSEAPELLRRCEDAIVELEEALEAASVVSAPPVDPYERAAKVCDVLNGRFYSAGMLKEAAAAIRALKEG